MAKVKYTAEFKTKIILAGLQGDIELQEICSKYSLPIELVCQWKQEFLQNAHFAFYTVFDRKVAKRRQNSLNKENARMGKVIVQLTLERDFCRIVFFKLKLRFVNCQGKIVKSGRYTSS